jgi:hypothetical protein
MRTACGCLFAAAVIATDAASASIGVELRPAHGVVVAGETIGIGVYVFSESSENELLSGAQVILGWEAEFLRLTGIIGAGSAPLLYSGFPMPDGFGLNESSPPQDGLGMYVAFSNLGAPVAATPGGTLLTTLVFEAMGETLGTWIEVVESAGMPTARTVVYDGTEPNVDVTGALRGATVTVIASPPAGAGLMACMALAARRRRSE